MGRESFSEKKNEGAKTFSRVKLSDFPLFQPNRNGGPKLFQGKNIEVGNLSKKSNLLALELNY